jgi:hypothetical protein
MKVFLSALAIFLIYTTQAWGQQDLKPTDFKGATTVAGEKDRYLKTDKPEAIVAD